MESEIARIEDAVRNAQLSADIAFLENILADDFQFVTPQGKILTKSQDLDQYQSGYLKLRTVDITDRTIQCYGPTAVVRFRVHFEGAAGAHAFSSLLIFTRIYFRAPAGWRMVAGHSSDLPKP